MSHLMCQGEDAVQCTAVVEQHIRMRPVDTPGVRAASLAFIFIDIDPAVIEAFLQKSQILISAGQALFHGFLCLFIRNLPVIVFHHRRI